MKALKAGLSALLAVLVIACQEPSKFDYRTALGVVIEKADRTCLDIRRGDLSPGQRIQFVTSSAPQTTGDAEIIRKADQACTAADQTKPGLYHYDIKVVHGSLQKGAPAFALANFGGMLTSTDIGITADLDRNGQTESFRSCTSAEGVHLTVWTGKPLEGQRRWHYYYYLGYEVDPTCAESDTKPDAP